ncbi:hypothetical protein [Chthoniobacter flavus]|uniref:hypothetical protein n=1 Tax=Chthoniobacter flavus TaxID=191863 RepID=UPI0003171069|nr:hypothetical protein [Chthoniobacter flavus]
MKFNTLLKRIARGNTTNLAGGCAFSQSPKAELVSILLTAMLGDQFYRSGDATAARVKQLVAATENKAFVAKAAIYARTRAGMRSVSHLVAAELARGVKGAARGRSAFYRGVVHRPDDSARDPRLLPRGLRAPDPECPQEGPRRGRSRSLTSTSSPSTAATRRSSSWWMR